MDDIQFSMDDFLIVESRVQSGFIFEEIERPEDVKMDMDIVEEYKDQISDPTSLEFLNMDVEKLFTKHSNAGLSGLSNLGNT